MNHMNLSDELRKQLLESAAWGKAGIVLSEGIVDDVKEAVDLDENARKGYGAEAPAGSKKPSVSAPSKTKKTKEQLAAEDKELDKEMEKHGMKVESVHVCPLCVSELEESIDEDRILEHLNVVVGLVDRLSQLQEGDEDIETVIDETIAELLLQNTDEE